MRFLLDTGIVSDLVRHPDGLVARRIAEVGVEQVCTSIIVAAELRYGAAKKRSPSLTERIEGVLARLEVLAFQPPADRHYGDLRSYLESIGRTIGQNDLLIAAHARSLGYIIVTDNVREFSRAPELRVENWLRS